MIHGVQLLDRQIDNVLGGAAGLAGSLLGRAHSAGRQVAGKVRFKSLKADSPRCYVPELCINVREALYQYAMSTACAFPLMTAAGPLTVMLVAVHTLVQGGLQTGCC